MSGGTDDRTFGYYGIGVPKSLSYPTNEKKGYPAAEVLKEVLEEWERAWELDDKLEFDAKIDLHLFLWL